MRHPSSSPAPLRSAAVALIALTLALSLAALAGCGGKNASTDAASPGASATPAPAAAAPATDTAAAPAAGLSASADPGERVFKTRCIICHGPSGHGDGVASKGLDPKPRNFHDKAYMSSKTDAELLTTIHNGKGVMPAWKGQLTEDEMKAVLAYVRKFAEQP
jgi:mono/diheme cytochrome c family protein